MEEQGLRIRIVHTAEIHGEIQYATLSHQWAKEAVVKLTVDNLSSWTQNVPPELLSRTFKEAIQVVRRLDIDYIWIDCLCIIQDGDDLKDWRQEAPAMKLVYSNACFNICASWGSELGGLFAPRNPATVEHAYFKLPSGTNHPKKYFLLGSEHVFHHGWDGLVEQSPLLDRGWVFQERLLARRNVFFCKDIVLFECYESRLSEAKGLDVNASENGMSNTPNIRDWLSTIPEDIYKVWYDTIERYSSTKLTYQQDRLPAIAGVAQLFKRLLNNDTYVAGLWLSRLGRDMLWVNVEAISRSEMQEASPTPTPLQMTYSWASSNTVKIEKVDLGNRILDKTFNFYVPRVTCVKWRASTTSVIEDHPSLEDIFMLPSTPCIEIKVEGHLRRMMLQNGPDRLQVFPVGPIRDRIIPDQYVDESVTATLDFALSDTEIAVLNESQGLFYVPWYGYVDNGTRRKPRSSYFLLLELTCSKMGRFRRIGLLHLGSISCRSMYLARQVDQENYPCWQYDFGWHTFFVV